MKIPFIKIFSIIEICLTADCVSDPIIEIQPRMNLKCISVNQDLCNGPVENKSVTTWRSTSNDVLFIVELKFIVNYRNFLSYYTPIQKIVTLKRYKKKRTPDERFDKSLHAHHEILSSEENCNTKIFQIDICVPDKEGFVSSNDIDEKRDVISFHSLSKTPAKTVSDIKKLNELLLTYMVDDIDELSSSGFQFSFVVIAEGSNGEVVTKKIVSHLFGFNHSKDLSFLTECVLNPDDFHMNPPLEVVNEGRFSKHTRSIRRKKYKSSNVIEKERGCIIL